MEPNKYKKKFEDVFIKLFQPDFELNRYYAENLVRFLEDCPDKNAEKIFDASFFSELILYSLAKMETTSNSVKVLIMEMTTILIKNELHFNKLQQLQGFEETAQKLLDAMSMPIPTIFISGLNLFTAQISHYTGLSWVIQHKIWTRVFLPDLHTFPSTVIHACCRYIAQLTWKLNEYGEHAALAEVLKFIVEPIKTSKYHNLHHSKVIEVEAEKNVYEPIAPNLNVLLMIVNGLELHKTSNIVRCMLRENLVNSPMKVIMEVSRDPDVVSLIFRILFGLKLHKVLQPNIKDVSPKDGNEIIIVYYNMINYLVLQKHLIPVALDFVGKSILFWSKAKNIEFERYGRTFEIRNQFMILLLNPLMVHCYEEFSKRNAKVTLERLDLYQNKVVDITTEHIVKIGYLFRTVISARSDRKKLVIETTKQLMTLKGHLSGTQAGIVYQALFYVLRIYVVFEDEGPIPLTTPDDGRLLSLTLEMMTLLLKEHNINWYETLEIIILQMLLTSLIEQNILSIKQQVQVLTLIELSIRKFLSPDLALLMETRTGSTLDKIGKVTKAFLQHDAWEIRDSALQLVHSCTDVAYIKYVPLQRLLSEHSLVTLAAHLALRETEMYAQATALRCLAAATKMDCLWKDVLAVYPNIYEELINVLKNNSEGIVRKEALNVLTELYVNRKVTHNLSEMLYKVMSKAAVDDLHWEVQLAALQFWKHTIKLQFSNRGMIDGKFPSVTFSKEKKKIIMLNESEIEKILISIMYNLSIIGCLTVLHKCLNEEWNIKVVELAYSVTNDLVQILNCHRIALVQGETTSAGHDDSHYESFISVQDTEMDSCPPLNNTHNRSEVIETIVNTNDADLMIELYNKSEEVKENVMECDNLVTKPIECLDPYKFIESFKATDYQAIIDGKKKWHSGPSDLDTLLDDILTLGEDNK